MLKKSWFATKTRTSRQRRRKSTQPNSVERLEERTLLSAVTRATAQLDTATIGGAGYTEYSTTNKIYRYVDDLIPVDETRSYTLSWSARSGDGNGGDYNAANEQWFGFRAYGADGVVPLGNGFFPVQTAVSESWTHMEAVLGSAGTAFPSGTKYIRPYAQLNMHTTGGWNTASDNTVHWRDVGLTYAPGENFATGEDVILNATATDLPNAEYTWHQLTGPDVLGGSTAGREQVFTAPDQIGDFQLSFQVVADNGYESSTSYVEVDIESREEVESTASAVVGASTLGGLLEYTADTAKTRYGDSFIAVNESRRYSYDWWAKAGNDAGGQFNPANVQSFGYRPYAADGSTPLSGAVYPLANVSVPNEWTAYNAEIGEGTSFAFPAGTHYVRFFGNLNQQANPAGDRIRWRDLTLNHAAGDRFYAGETVTLHSTLADIGGVSYFWRQIYGPRVTLDATEGKTVTFTAPAAADDYVATFELVADDGYFSVVDSISIHINANTTQGVNGQAVLGAYTIGGLHDFATDTKRQQNALEAFDVDVHSTYRLSWWARSGVNDGTRYDPANLQSFGFKSIAVNGGTITTQFVEANATVVDEWTYYEAEIGAETDFSFPTGTTTVRAYGEFNLHESGGWNSGSGNRARWRDIALERVNQQPFRVAEEVTLVADVADLSNPAYTWMQTSGTPVSITPSSSNGRISSFIAPTVFLQENLTFQVRVAGDEAVVYDSVVVQVTANQRELGAASTLASSKISNLDVIVKDTPGTLHGEEIAVDESGEYLISWWAKSGGDGAYDPANQQSIGFKSLWFRRPDAGHIFFDG